jgi:hypothetical protein
MTTPNLGLMKAVERLNYRGTVGDVAAQAGLDVKLAERDLLALASEVGGHLQVAESGEIVYQFPANFRAILRNNSLRLRLADWWSKIWKILFYLIRISFGLVLIASIVLISIAIILLTLAASASQDGDQGDWGGEWSGMPGGWFGGDFLWVFYPDYNSRRYERQRRSKGGDERLNFLEAVFSFLFGDGDPNRDLEERRWRAIGQVIRNHQGAVVAEQLAPYLDLTPASKAQDNEDYMLPVLTRFNGRPEVSPEGGLVYHFPDLQTSAIEQRFRAVQAYLQEFPWRFSRAGAGQILFVIGLGSVNLIGALALGKLMGDGIAAVGLVAFVQSIYWLLLGYGAAFLAVPLLRYFWIQWRNRRIETRNESRRSHAIVLNQADDQLQAKLAFAQEFAALTVIGDADVIYTTEQDLVEQEVAQSDRIDAEWQRRLESSSPQTNSEKL